MIRKLKRCSGCGKDSYLWKSNPPLCKTCAMRKNDSADNRTVQKKKKVPKRIAPVSEKQKERLAEYRKVRDKYLRGNPTCEICGINRDLTLHHKKTRQYHLCDVEVFMTLCISCHEKVHREDKWARDKGYLINSR